jgi:ADP-heptose:LPS heptosyltransferase
LSDEEKDFQNLFLERHNITGKEKVIAVAPGGMGSAVRSKIIASQWPVQNYIELIQKFQSEGPSRIILVGGPDDREITSRIIEVCPSSLDATDLSLGDMASVLRRCSLFIGNDNVRNPIAVAMRIPNIRVFNPVDFHPPTSHNNAQEASAASGKVNTYNEEKLSRSTDPENRVAVSLGEVWQHINSLNEY